MRKIPPTRYPLAVEKQYAKDLLKMIDEVERMVMLHYKRVIVPQLKNYRADDDELNTIQRILEITRALSLNIFSDNNIVNIAKRFVNNLDLFNMKNITDQARVAGISVVQDTPKLKDFVESSVTQNVSYIKSIESNLLDKVSTLIFEETVKGTASKQIQEQLMQSFNVSRSKAKFIAVDQSGSIFGQLTKERHTSIGVEKFTWLSAGDKRVRPEHQNYNGKTYTYKDGANGKFPGSSDYRCRCVGQPVFE